MNFTDFIFENININESMFYISPSFRFILSRMDNEIASSLLDVEFTDIKTDITFVDLTDKEGFVSFTQIKKADRLISSDFYNLDLVNGRYKMEGTKIRRSQIDYLFDNDVNGIRTKARSEVKIGKVVNKIFPGKFKDKEVEEFVNLFKSSNEKSEKEFKMVSGDEIIKWYNCDSYSSGKGNLGSSCMRNSKPSIFELYVKNPEVCRLLILVKNGKLLGRALVWKVSIPKSLLLQGMEYFMDRVYVNIDSDENKFHRYAEKMGWGRKTINNYSSHNKVTYKGREYLVNMKVDLNHDTYDNYPYMDTFSEFFDGSLYNNNTYDNGGYLLTDTQGGYEEYEEDGLWSDYYERTIPREEAIWSDALSDYIIDSESTYITGYGYYPTDHDDIEWVDDRSEYYLKKDLVYSENLDIYLHKEDSVNIITDFQFSDQGNGEGSVSNESYYPENDNDVVTIESLEKEGLLWYKILNKKYSYDDYDGIDVYLLIKDYKGRYIPDGYVVETYGTVDDSDEKFLTVEDHKLINNKDINTDDYEKRVEDEFTYMKRTWADKGDELSNFYKNNIRNYKNDTRVSDIVDFLNKWFGKKLELSEGMKHLKSFKLFESKISKGYTMYSGISLDKWETIWKDKKLKDKLTNVTDDDDFAYGYSYNFKTGKYDDVLVEISDIPLEAFVAYREEDYEDDDDFISMNNMNDINKERIIDYESLFLVDLYPYKDVIKTKLIHR